MQSQIGKGTTFDFLVFMLIIVLVLIGSLLLVLSEEDTEVEVGKWLLISAGIIAVCYVLMWYFTR